MVLLLFSLHLSFSPLVRVWLRALQRTGSVLLVRQAAVRNPGDVTEVREEQRVVPIPNVLVPSPARPVRELSHVTRSLSVMSQL